MLTLSLLHVEPNAMRRDDALPQYRGSFVTLNVSPDGLLYTVAIEPPIPGSENGPITFGCKSQAWSQGAAWWRLHGLPFKDLTDGNTGREQASYYSEN
jgi:hypothetical protein